MRRALFALLLVAGFLPLGAKEFPRYVVIYTTNVINPNLQTAAYCPDHRPDCNNVYMAAEQTMTFGSMKQAISFLNNRETTCASGGSSGAFGFGYSCQFGPIKPEEFVGLYKLIPIPVGSVKVGTEKKQITKTVEEDVDKMEWQENP